MYNDIESQCRAHGNLGVAFNIQQNFQQAFNSYKKQLELAKQTNVVFYTITQYLKTSCKTQTKDKHFLLEL